MKKMIIFDPAMCCSTGVCGPSVDPELLRVATTINRLKSNGVLVERYNLTSNPQIFVDNKEINEILNREGVEILPVTMVDGIVVKTKAYPTNKEFCELLDISEDYLKIIIKNPCKGCNCKGGCC
ncbi:transcriptional regulator [Clostridium botulinum]|uniref:arsenite efflux transporter metallochaperone ArsD n=1 Tax=Clostridium botulinum TaxID=1491 RepID=UPI00099DDFD8|nr:arsenite efflux transporter metallochaperone ArsD [Clostridium botulinum]NFA96476.1 arsenite efflux transporter metallochaperone ArsD [Clostridium botulinum]NFB51398.1 arsenite efflux transporter metallochaperone ArsD [Clostridium botulinum]NFC76821.1 arsenite efflux transporter metallochaperone ArsD [Clostridium botulinum]NFC87622.1 arsenite efflux transporter metallochaperone ArsD [Clostridium botulinum]NFD05832.1 arsenite efflux transporter metallochaperone ArsD [Clostridium botulinum]